MARRCEYCHTLKEPHEFRKDGGVIDGLSRRCRDCERRHGRLFGRTLKGFAERNEEAEKEQREYEETHDARGRPRPSEKP